MQIAKILVDSRIPIHKRYHLLVESLETHSPVLKTDLWNELYTDWPIKADIYVEFDAQMVQKAIKLGLNVKLDDIRHLQIKSKSVQTIIDLSTIDHIEDPLPALKEYHRILKSETESNCYIICWIGNQNAAKMSNWNGWQYYFSLKDFIWKVSKSGFSLISMQAFKGMGDDKSQLVFFHLKKEDIPFINLLKRLKNSLCYNKSEQESLAHEKSIVTSHLFLKLKPLEILMSEMLNIENHQLHTDHSSISLRAINNDPQIILPESILPKSNIMIEVELSAPEITYIEIFYKCNKNIEYDPNFSVKEKIEAGRNKIQLYIPDDNIRDKIRLDPGVHPGIYTIHHIGIFQWT